MFSHDYIGVMDFEAECQRDEGHIMLEDTWYHMTNTTDEHLVKALSVRFPHCKIIIFLFPHYFSLAPICEEQVTSQVTRARNYVPPL